MSGFEAPAPRTGLIKIDTTRALCDLWPLSLKEVGTQWLAYLRGESSIFEQFSTHKPRRPSARPHWYEWSKTRERIFDRDGWRCTYCGAADKPLECDHIHPVALGGAHTDDNLTTACRPCNIRKGARTADDFLATGE